MLLVEDHQTSAAALARILRRYGHSVDVAHTVAAARQLLDVKAFDLVLCDYELPDGCGADLCRELPRWRPEARAIAVSAYLLPDAVNRMLAAGCVAYLPKPLAFDDLLKAMAAAVATQPAVASRSFVAPPAKPPAS